jgi:membrane protease YdiL (CAAX protease family)
VALTLENFVASFELALAFGGAVLMWRLVLSPAARARRTPPALVRWDVALGDFFVFLFFVIAGSFLGAVIASLIGKRLPIGGDEVTVFNGAGAQLGMLVGAAFYLTRPERGSLNSIPGRAGIFASGVATFLVSLPLLLLTSKLSEVVLQAFSLPVERQSLIAMFANAESPWMLITLIVLAIVMAPVTEELVFRGGLFRYCRTRMPRWASLLVPALLFASLHVNWVTLEGLASFAPLAVLAIMFSLAYERTGHIGTPMVAHALFNLNTVILIFAGVGT